MRPLFSYYSNVATLSIFKATISVIYPYLIVTYLNSSATELSVFQTILLTLGIIFGPIGGYLADRSDPARLLARLQWFSLFPLMILLIALWQDILSYELLIVLGILGFAALSMTQPPLDILIHALGDDKVQKRISGSLFLAYVTSVIGYIIAASTDFIGVSAVTLIVIALLATGGLLSLSMVGKYDSHPVEDNETGSFPEAQSFWVGYKFAYESPLIRPTVFLMASAGFFLGGPIGIMVPLLLRDFYGGDATQFALVYGFFMFGGAISNALIGAISGVILTGLTLALGFLFCIVALVIWSMDTSFIVFLFGSWVWGVGGGICLCMSRTIVQMNVPQNIRARTLSAMYSLDEGAAPIGAIVSGFVVSIWGAQQLAMFCAIGTFVTLVMVYAFSAQLRRGRAAQPSA